MLLQPFDSPWITAGSFTASPVPGQTGPKQATRALAIFVPFLSSMHFLLSMAMCLGGTFVIGMLLISGGTLGSGDPVIRQALTLLGDVNPVAVLSGRHVREIYARTPGAGSMPRGLIAFRLPNDPVIYLNRESVVYRSAAAKVSTFASVRLAATLLHEQVHSTDGEYEATRIQADFVLSRMQHAAPRGRSQLRKYWEVLNARAISLARAEQLRRRKSARPAEAR